MEHPTIEETIEWATKLHSKQRDKAGVPYIVHPLTVMRYVPEEMWHVAVLHDVIEDCFVSIQSLLDAGYSHTEVEALDLLSRRKNQSYSNYIDRIIQSENGIAITVKIADLDDNLNSRRGPIDRKLELRYHAARLRLEIAVW